MQSAFRSSVVTLVLAAGLAAGHPQRLAPIAPTDATEAPASATGHEADDAIELNADLVLVSAVVLKEGSTTKHVERLGASDFELRVDSVPQAISFFADEASPLDVEFVFDASESVRARQILQRTLLARFLDGLIRPADSASVVWFDNGVHVEQDFTSRPDALLAAIDRIPSGGATALYDAIAKTSDRIATRAGRRAIVILSDGHDTFSDTRLEKALGRALDADAVIYAVNTSRPKWAVTDEFRRDDALEFLASETGGEVFYLSEDRGDVEKTLELLAARLRKRYVLGFYPDEGAADGRMHRIRVSVPKLKARVLSRAGYTAPLRAR